MSATTRETAVSGLKLVESCNFNRHIAGSIIATRDDWAELLDSIPAPDIRKHVAAAVWGIREALGLEADHALDICQGRE